MNYHNIPLLTQRDSHTSMSYMLFQENNLVTYRGRAGAMVSWGGFSSWRSKQSGQKLDLSISPQNVHVDVPPPPSPVKACSNPLPEPPDPELVEVHAPSSTPDVDVMFGAALLGKIRHISLFSAAMAKVRVYQVKCVHKEAALQAEGFTVSQPRTPRHGGARQTSGTHQPLSFGSPRFPFTCHRSGDCLRQRTAVRSRKGPLFVHKQAPLTHGKGCSTPPPNGKNL